MSCPKNPQKFLGLIPYEGAHDLHLVQVNYYTTTGTLIRECLRCGCRETKYLLDEAMVREGFDVKKLRAAAKIMVAAGTMPEFSREMFEEFYEKS